MFGALAPGPVWAQVAPATERNPAAAGAVAVLPFENISGQPQDDWLGAGIAESVLADLETRNAAVIGPAVLLAEARREGTDLEVERNVIALSRRLGAAWLVTGSYQHTGELLRIIARVVDVRTGAATSTVKVDGRREDLFQLQDRIVAELAFARTNAVAVLPFENISGQPQDDWLGAGIAESVLADLETRNAAVPIGPAALLAEARREGTDLEVERNAIALSRRLGAAWLVTGGYQHFGDLLRIIGRVVDVRTGITTSTVKVDGRREDFFELQDRIVAELALRAPLAPPTGGVTGGQGSR